jgi:hypothetical protein
VLVWPNATLGPMLLLAWLAWPPAFVIAWIAARDPPPDREPVDGQSSATPARIAVAAIIGAVALASLAYQWLMLHHLGQTAALFIGLPALLAIVVVFWVSPRSATGVACKAVTIGLLVSLLFLGEGVLCVVMSAPLFYVVAIMIGSAVDLARRRPGSLTGRTLSCIGLLALLPMSLEGVTGATTLNRDEWIAVTRIVRAPAPAVERAMFELPRFDRPLPFYLRVGFPRPQSTAIERSPAGTRWIIRMRGGEIRLDGRRLEEPPAGDLSLELEESRPGLAKWRAIADGSHMTHYLSWREVRVEWEPITADTTSVTWTLRYSRGLDPAWYFGPWERYAARLAAGYLIESIATP